jgi:DNA-directed RNA polymerase subunit RPC12/RpoP
MGRPKKISIEQCPHCGEHRLRKDGEVLTKSGSRQSYSCGHCGKRFSEPMKVFRPVGKPLIGEKYE